MSSEKENAYCVIMICVLLGVCFFATLSSSIMAAKLGGIVETHIQLDKAMQDKIEKLMKLTEDRPSEKKAITLWGNNPGNVKGSNWEGQTGNDKRGFATFKNHAYGLRAMAITLLEYQYKHGISTVESLVRRYSRSGRAEYTRFLCRRLKLRRTEHFKISERLPELMKAMITMEHGHQPYPDEAFVLLSVAGRH